MGFTDLLIKNLKPKDKKYYRRDAGGFTIRVMPTGVKTWLYIYTFDGRRKEMNLGLYCETDGKVGVSLAVARSKYNTASNLLKNGIDPASLEREQQEERRLAPTITDIAEEYIEKWAKPRKKSWESDERVLNKEIIPAWGKLKTKDIRKRDVVLLLEGIIKRGSPVMANRIRALLHKLFTFALDRDIIGSNPCSGVKPLAPEKPKERALTEDEIRTFWEGLNRTDLIMSSEIKRALKLILITGQRPGEVAGIHRNEISGNWWTIPAERCKNGKAHRVYLTEIAKEIIGESKEFIFPSPRSPHEQSITAGALHCALRRNIKGQEYRRKNTKKTYKPKPENPNRLGVADFTPHDLRRTVATRMAEQGVMEEIIDRVLNHSRRGIIRVYNHYTYDKEIQGALETWEQKLKQILAGKEIPMVISSSTAKKPNRKNKD